MFENITITIVLWVKKVKCAMFCSKPFELLNYCEQTDKGTVGGIRCPQCGNELFIFNKK